MTDPTPRRRSSSATPHSRMRGQVLERLALLTALAAVHACSDSGSSGDESNSQLVNSSSPSNAPSVTGPATSADDPPTPPGATAPPSALGSQLQPSALPTPTEGAVTPPATPGVPPPPVGTPAGPQPSAPNPTPAPTGMGGAGVDVPVVVGMGGAPSGGAGPAVAGTGGTPPGAAGADTGVAGAGTPTTPVSDLPPNPSGLPEPGPGGVVRPSGAAANLTVLPWAGFSGAITYTFDDANSTQINNESQLLGLGVPFTFYLQTGKQEAGNAFFQRALDAGHELANHTQSHGSGAADNDVNQAQQFLMNTFGVVAYTMAAPNGSTNNYTSIAQQLFIIDRGVSDSLIGPDDNVNLLNLPSYIPPTGAGTSQLNPKADAAQSQGKWQTLCIHGFSGGSDGAYQPIDLDGFIQHVEYTKDKGDVWIGTMLDVGAYFIGRKAVAGSSAQAEGADQVWTWTLPEVFPPGHYVRVTVDGGTLSQDGTPLPWNEHGFYEVALDVGSLTLSP